MGVSVVTCTDLLVKSMQPNLQVCNTTASAFEDKQYMENDRESEFLVELPIRLLYHSVLQEVVIDYFLLLLDIYF